MIDYIKRSDAINAVYEEWDKWINYDGSGREIASDTEDALCRLDAEDVAPVRNEEDGTLWVTVEDCEKVGRVIIKNEQGHFCRVFYMGEDDE